MNPRLIVADDSSIMRMMVEELVKPDYTVVASVEDGRAAVNGAQQLRPDLVLLDVSMPILDGFEAARQIKQLCPLTLLIFVSEHREQVYAAAAFDAGGSGYVLKSKMISDLLPAIRAVLAGGEHGRPDGCQNSRSKSGYK